MKKLLPILIFFFSFNVFSQKEADFWFFGENAGINFGTTPPNAVSGSLSTDEGSASISDASGVLQFYTDGSTVYDRTGAIMVNGTGLHGHPSSAQSAIIVPKPLNASIYYIFTVDDQNNSNGVEYSVVDMSLNGGLGEVTRKNIALASAGNAREKITSVKGIDCNTFWVITSDRSTFYSYKVDASGVNTTPEKQSSHINTTNLRGYLKLSPNGKYLVNASASSGSYFYDFNAQTGVISNERVLDVTGDGYGVEFSRDSKQLYITTGTFSQFSGASRNPPALATIQKFNLDRDNDGVTDNISDINSPLSKKEIYRTSSGYRGALQLASNGKIYYARSRTSFLGVINSPEAEDSNVDFIENGLNLGSRISTEGLPPFIQSFFLPIEITDTDTGAVINNEDLQFCVGNDKTISPATITGSAITYSWTFDDGSGAATISNTQKLVLTNLQNSNSGKYALKIELKDSCGNNIEYNATFNIEVFEAAVATKPTDIFFCDTDRNGFNDFNLQDNVTGSLKNQILNGLNLADFDVLYFKSMADANSGTSPLPNPYTNSTAFSTETIYARVQNKLAPNACFDVTDFTLAVTDLPEPTQPDPYRICDDKESGSDTDGIVNTFNLDNTIDNEIYGSLDKTKYTISYHTTKTGADTNDAATIIPKNVDFTVTNSKTVYIRIENNDNPDCYDANLELKLIVDPLPTYKTTTPEIDQCIAAGSPNPTVNLTLAEKNISNNYLNETFEYYTDIAGTDLISNPTSYPVVSDTHQSVYVKAISEHGCSREIIKLTLKVASEGNHPYNTLQPPVCDDFLDADGNDTVANSDTDNITHFSLDETSIIAGIRPPVNTTVFFYENATDRTNSLNEIDITNFRNDITKNDVTAISGGIQFPIYYKILSDVNNDCQGLGQFYVQIDAVPTETIVSDLELCDDAVDGSPTNGIVQSFDLESQTPLILGMQSDADFTVTYHISAADANSGNAPLVSPYANTIRDSQQIFVRVTNNATGCFTDHTSFNVIVNPLPIANFVDDLEICDDNSDGSARNGFSQNIDLESQTSGILGTQDPTTFSVTYHRTLADAQSGTTPLVSPYTNSIPNRETIYVRVYNVATGCTNGISNFDVIINPEPTSETISNLSYCDNNLDSDDTNGIIQNIDLDAQITNLLGTGQLPADFNVTFHKSQAEATSGIDAIASPYTNTNPTETIYVRIQNKATGCVNDDATFQIIVNPLPSFDVFTPQILCLNDLPLTISAENPSEIYSYEWTDVSGKALGTNQDLEVTVGGTYTITATTTNGTNCTRTREIIVNESNPANLESSFVTIIDESNNIGSENVLSIYINTIDNDLGPGDYQFAILNTDNNERTPIIGFQDEPLFENIEGGIYQIIINDKNGCSPDATLLVSVIQFPKFFTPNGDGENDTFVVKGANKIFYPNSSINIFNRFGKLVAQIPIGSQGWDGTYSGKKLPADDYWYNITLIPADTTKPTISKKGNLSLLRK